VTFSAGLNSVDQIKMLTLVGMEHCNRTCSQPKVRTILMALMVVEGIHHGKRE
jgi:hypothetical protein